MLKILIIYGVFALLFFFAMVFVAKSESTKLNAELSRDCYSVNYKGLILKALLFPLTIAIMLFDMIEDARKRGRNNE